MKKIIMLLTVAAMLATSVMCVSAEETKLPEYTAEGGKYTGVTHSGLTANEYYGVVVVKGTENATIDFNNKDNILYIDQVTADNTGAITIPAFMTKGTDLVEGTIFIGGAGLPGATTIGYLKLAQSEEPEMFVISGTIVGNEGPTAATVTVTDGTTPYTATVSEDGSFTVEVPVLESGAYTLTTTKTGYLGYTKSDIASETTGISAVIKTGEIEINGTVDLQDLLSLLEFYNDSVTTIEKDYDENGVVDLQDLLSLLANYNDIAVSE